MCRRCCAAVPEGAGVCQDRPGCGVHAYPTQPRQPCPPHPATTRAGTRRHTTKKKVHILFAKQYGEVLYNCLPNSLKLPNSLANTFCSHIHSWADPSPLLCLTAAWVCG